MPQPLLQSTPLRFQTSGGHRRCVYLDGGVRARESAKLVGLS